MRIEQCIVFSLLLTETQPLVYRAVVSACLRSDQLCLNNHSLYARERRRSYAWHCTNEGLSPSPLTLLGGRQTFFMAVKRDFRRKNSVVGRELVPLPRII